MSIRTEGSGALAAGAPDHREDTDAGASIRAEIYGRD